MKNLPKVYAKPIEKVINNNNHLFYSKFQEERSEAKNIVKEIDNIFHSKDFVYKKEVELVTKQGIITTAIVGKNGNYLLTLDGQKILINEIESIKKL